MPWVDGIEVMRKLKSTTILCRIPITILTSSLEAGNRVMSYDLGASSCLVTPISFEVFMIWLAGSTATGSV